MLMPLNSSDKSVVSFNNFLKISLLVLRYTGSSLSTSSRELIFGFMCAKRDVTKINLPYFFFNFILFLVQKYSYIFFYIFQILEFQLNKALNYLH